MQRGIIGRARLLAAATAAVVTLVALPSVASATVVSSGTGSHTQRESWVRYISTFGGTVRATGSASYNAGSATVFTDDVLTLAFDGANTTYNLTGRTAGSGTIALSGGVDYAVPAHFISVRISDPRITVATPSTTATVARRRLLRPVRDDGFADRQPDDADPRRRLHAQPVGRLQRHDHEHTWTNAPAALTAAGANAFNGGINGSCENGRPVRHRLVSRSTI